MNVSIGVDVAEARKGLDVVALDGKRAVIAQQARAAVEDVVEHVRTIRPDVVCIDAPPAWASQGRSREAERQLRAIGITAFATPTDPGDHGFYRWMRVGFSIYAAISDLCPRYRSGSVRGTAVEVFPEATAVLLAGRLRRRDESKRQFRCDVLEAHGVDTNSLRTVDAIDAALAALTGVLALEGSFASLGQPSEGVIVVPVASLPVEPLPRQSGLCHGGPP
jgi:predicted nuclease with RNAse H fold